jgi:type II secretory pathway component PulJ
VVHFTSLPTLGQERAYAFVRYLQANAIARAQEAMRQQATQQLALQQAAAQQQATLAAAAARPAQGQGQVPGGEPSR